MHKNIWMLNHYATNMYFNKGGRHHWFAKHLPVKGYNPTIFCANTRHNSDEVIEINYGKYTSKETDGVSYVFVKTSCYKGNGISRIKNILRFYQNLHSAAKKYTKSSDKPDVILASSVHPLTLVAGIRIARRFGIPCICEVRDLWPETIVAYGRLKKSSLIAKILYQGEKWIYKKADKLIFTMEGGRDYIIDKGWDKGHGGPIDLDKVHHINNGIDLEAFDDNCNRYSFKDDDLDDKTTFKVIYTGSIRQANNLELIIDAAKYVLNESDIDIRLIIFGEGSDREKLEERCTAEGITNVAFKGKVDKEHIPFVLKQSNLNILNYSYHDIWKYGGSQNKMFEYLASGRPILSTITMGYDIIGRYGAGISLCDQSPESIGDAVIKIANMDREEYTDMSTKAREAARDYDFRELTDRLIEIVESPY